MAVGNYVDRANPDGPFQVCDANQILRPSPQGSYQSTALTPGFCPLSILAAKDARQRSTLRISNDRQYYVRGGYEQMWDIEDQRFLGPEDNWKQVSLWGMGIASRDLTGDGRDEVMLTSMGDQLMQVASLTAPMPMRPLVSGPMPIARIPAMTGGHPPAGTRNLPMWIMTVALICSSPKEMWTRCRDWRWLTPITC
jgi:enediyne biosynthesis protein E4